MIEKSKFTLDKYACYHPAGSLGKKVTKVKDIMIRLDEIVVSNENETVLDSIIKMTAAKSGCTIVCDTSGKLKGIFTDGDFRRLVIESKSVNPLKYKIKDVMNNKCIYLFENCLVERAYEIFKKNGIWGIPIVNKFRTVKGLIDIKTVMNE